MPTAQRVLCRAVAVRERESAAVAGGAVTLDRPATHRAATRVTTRNVAITARCRIVGLPSEGGWGSGSA